MRKLLSIFSAFVISLCFASFTPNVSACSLCSQYRHEVLHTQKIVSTPIRVFNLFKKYFGEELKIRSVVEYDKDNGVFLTLGFIVGYETPTKETKVQRLLLGPTDEHGPDYLIEDVSFDEELWNVEKDRFSFDIDHVAGYGDF